MLIDQPLDFAAAGEAAIEELYLGALNEWAITAPEQDPDDVEPFPDEHTARAALWAEGGERLWVREVTPWRHA